MNSSMSDCINTSRLVLRRADSSLLLAAIEGNESLQHALQAEAVGVPADWPPEHVDRAALQWTLDALQVGTADPCWSLYFILTQASPRTLVGTCGFKGPPDARGCVELGYSVVPGWQRQGIATEAVLALKQRAREAGAVRLAAETLPELSASLRVMEKSGLWPVQPAAEAGVLRGECSL